MCGIHFYKSILKVIRTGANVEEACRELGRLRGCIKCPMIGQCVDFQRIDCAIFIGCNLRLDMIVTSKPRTAQVFCTVLNPLDRLARYD